MSALAVEPPQTRAHSAPRLLPPAGGVPSLAAHRDRYGPLPAVRGEGRAVIAAVEASGLRGRGGAGFPTAVKLAAVAAGRGPIVVANGVEGEPGSHKDALLLRVNPHLVLDGAVVAAAAVGARKIVIAVGRGASAAHASVASAIAERAAAGERIGIELAAAPERFVAGEETALVQWLNGGPAKPAFVPPRPFERGVGGRPTLVQNVETLANIALIARFGSGWFRELGTAAEPGSMLLTLGGAVARPGITEVAAGTTLRAALERCGQPAEVPSAVLVGGYFGTWISAAALDVPLSDAGLRPLGAALGARSIAVLPRGRLRPDRDRAGGRLPGGRERGPVRPLRLRAAGDRRCSLDDRELRRWGLRGRAPAAAARTPGHGPRCVRAPEWRNATRRECACRVRGRARPPPRGPLHGRLGCVRPAHSGGERGLAMSRKTMHLRVNPIRCDAYGHCAELLPELIALDEWGYPIIADGPVPHDLRNDARRAVALCPRLALLLEQRAVQKA